MLLSIRNVKFIIKMRLFTMFITAVCDLVFFLLYKMNLKCSQIKGSHFGSFKLGTVLKRLLNLMHVSMFRRRGGGGTGKGAAFEFFGNF